MAVIFGMVAVQIKLLDQDHIKIKNPQQTEHLLFTLINGGMQSLQVTLVRDYCFIIIAMFWITND